MTMRKILLASLAALALTGGAPPSGQAANPTPTQSFTSALTGYSIYRQYLFGTGAKKRRGAPIVPITNTTDLGNYFTPNNSYGQTKFNGNEWQRFVGTLADTKALQFTRNSIKLTAYIAGGLYDGGVNGQMLVWRVPKSILAPDASGAWGSGQRGYRAGIRRVAVSSGSKGRGHFVPWLLG